MVGRPAKGDVTDHHPAMQSWSGRRDQCFVAAPRRAGRPLSPAGEPADSAPLLPVELASDRSALALIRTEAVELLTVLGEKEEDEALFPGLEE
jgi:hypothetical protein